MIEFRHGKKYNIIYADPPWQFNNKRTGGSMKSGAEQHYITMDLVNICELPIHTICDNDCVLFMWWITSMPQEAIEVVHRWGFQLKTMTGFVWNKTTKHGKPHFGMGHETRAGAECCLIAKRGNLKRVSASVRSVVTAPIGKHSQKPQEVADRIVQLYGYLPRIELFARDRKTGWDSWGNEI